MNGESVPISPFKFALLYLCFAQGVLTDLTLAPCSEEGETYHHLACVALALRSIFDSPTTEAVQSILVGVHNKAHMVNLLTRALLGNGSLPQWRWKAIHSRQCLGAWVTRLQACPKCKHSQMQIVSVLSRLQLPYDRLGCVRTSLCERYQSSLTTDRDPARWNMGAKCIEKRRRLFWEVYSTDLFFVSLIL